MVNLPLISIWNKDRLGHKLVFGFRTKFLPNHNDRVLAMKQGNKTPMAKIPDTTLIVCANFFQSRRCDDAFHSLRESRTLFGFSWSKH